MSQFRDKQLLTDVLADDNADFREAFLNQTLRNVRRKRRFRKVRHAAFASLMVVALPLIGFHFLVSKPPVSERPEAQYFLVTTQPLAAFAVISTRTNDTIAVVSSSPTVQLVTTSERSPLFRQLGDDELLALLPSPALLVRRGPHLAEVVFAKPDVQNVPSPN
jgi:hypothetical protein